MSEVIKNKLFLGDIFDANNSTFLREKNITAIINVAADAKIMNESKNIRVYKYKLNDDHECDISKYFDEIMNIINNENIVLVNCVAGISRSSTFVLVYLMRYHHLTLKDAFKFLRNKRSQICPNKKFMEYLLEEEFNLYSCNSLTHNECVQLFFYT